MFQLGYLFLLLLAAFPLGRTFLNQQAGGSPVVFMHRLYRDLAYIVAAVLGIICFEAAFDISLQNYWFEELGQRYRYWLALGLSTGIFAAVFVVVGLFVGYNLRTLCRPLPVVPNSAPWFAAFIFSAILAFGTTTAMGAAAGLSRRDRHRHQRPGIRQGHLLLSAGFALV